MDAEYQACGAFAREVLSLRKLLRELCVLCHVLWTGEARFVKSDNKTGVSFCSDRKGTKRTKHIDIMHHFARDRVASGELNFVFCKSEENVADCLTKALPRLLFEAGLRGLGML
jgi:hypothetical protein